MFRYNEVCLYINILNGFITTSLVKVISNKMKLAKKMSTHYTRHPQQTKN